MEWTQNQERNKLTREEKNTMNEEKLTTIHTHIRRKYEHCTTTTKNTKNLTIKRNMFNVYALCCCQKSLRMVDHIYTNTQTNHDNQVKKVQFFISFIRYFCHPLSLFYCFWGVFFRNGSLYLFIFFHTKKSIYRAHCVSTVYSKFRENVNIRLIRCDRICGTATFMVWYDTKLYSKGNII